jgi:hypothetical protein
MREKDMNIVITIAMLSFAVAAIVILNNGTVDKEYKRRQSHWNKYQG